MLRLARVLPMLVLLSAIAACYGGRPTRPANQGDPYLIKSEELSRTNQTNVYDAVRQLRPFWITRTGEAGIAVYLDEQLIGGLGTLRRIPLHVAQRVRYMRPSEAQVRFGSVNGLRAAILVDSERP